MTKHRLTRKQVAAMMAKSGGSSLFRRGKRSKLKYKAHSRVVKSVGYQTGRFGNVERDEALPAKLPGKRKTEWGTTYWETRRNRSDMKGLPI